MDYEIRTDSRTIAVTDDLEAALTTAVQEARHQSPCRLVDRDGRTVATCWRDGQLELELDPPDQVIDMGGPGGPGRRWRVVTDHPTDDSDVRNAAVHARVTGSVGCTYNDATVTRAAPLDTHIDGLDGWLPVWLKALDRIPA